jgi:glycosyltransferase involved in cell wall biosynthesis
MRIAFDGTTLRPGRTGVGYYSEHLLQHLAQESGHDVIVLSNGPVETTRPLPRRVTIAASSWKLPRAVWMQTLAPREVKRAGADVVHFTNGMVPIASPAPTVVTIHDMSLTLWPQFHPPRRVMLNRPLVNLAARRADAVITVSESARRDIVRLYGLPPGRVHVIHEAAAPSFAPVYSARQLRRVRQAYGLAERFVLYVGTIEPRKNLPNLLEGFARRVRSGDLPHQLVCVGPYGWRSRDVAAQVERLGIGDAVKFAGYVPFADLPALYTLAEMFVFPSLYEGFGLPVIEAMACGTPVITGRVSALTEVGGTAVEQADGLDAEAIGEAIVRLATRRDRREQLAALGLERSQQFSWSRAARETLEVYRLAARRTAGAAAAPPAFAELSVEPWKWWKP